MPDWLSVYHRLPYGGRVLTASLRGWYLRQWRYDRETEARVSDALAREHWSRLQWHAWREETLGRMLHRAATAVPYYCQHWQERRRRGDQASWEILENWPILEKDAVRENPKAFVADDCDTRLMFEEHTSGTTGKPLRLWWSRDTVRRWFALYEARIRNWHGVSRRNRWAILGGQLVVPFDQSHPPFWVWNAGLRQLYLSSYHITSQNVDAYLEAMRRHEVEYLIGYPSAMESLAREAVERKLSVPALRVIVSNAEPLYPHQRRLIEAAFGCAVRNTYGMAEIVAMSSECAAGSLHLWPEVGIADVRHDRESRIAADGNEGRLVCTGLLNQDMPLIKYEVGDRGRLAPNDRTCTCGRTLPILEDVEGRTDDVVRTMDGRTIGRLDPVFKADLPVREAQIVQETLEHIRVRLVPANGFTAAHEQKIISRLKDRVGDVRIVVEQVSRIPRTGNGKFRGVISHVDLPDDVLVKSR